MVWINPPNSPAFLRLSPFLSSSLLPRYLLLASRLPDPPTRLSSPVLLLPPSTWTVRCAPPTRFFPPVPRHQLAASSWLRNSSSSSLTEERYEGHHSAQGGPPKSKLCVFFFFFTPLACDCRNGSNSLPRGRSSIHPPFR